MTAAISLSGVTKRFGKFTAVDKLDLEVPVGVTFGLLGPNGAGKTTTIRMTMNITKADEGTVRILGRTLDEEGQQRIGYLPEERGLYRKMTVLDQLLFFAAIKGVERKTALERLERWIDVMDLRPWLKKKTEELSKGMQQKVQFLGTTVAVPLQRLIGSRWAIGADLLGTVTMLGMPALTTNPWLIAASIIGGGAGSAMWSIVVTSIRQQAAPDAMLGRVPSAFRLCGFAGPTLGAAAGGALAEVVGLRPVFAACAVLSTLLLIPFIRIVTDTELRSARQTPRPDAIWEGGIR